MHAVVVGSGIAGLTVALHAVESGCRVTLVTKDVLEHANTRYAQGGIAGVMFADDRAEDHIRDTLTAGAGLSDPAAVQVLVDEGPTRIRELIALGVAFDRSESGEFVKGLEAAHSYPRILHSGGDATGTAIEKALVARLRASEVRVIEHAFLVDIVVQEGRACGVELLVGDVAVDADGPDAASGVLGRREVVEADAVVLATGGAGELYAHSTNPEVATGDGIAAAIRVGAEVADLEFFQFHPTVLGIGESFLVSEAVRGEGATLIDEAGRRFAFDSHPDGELAPRDVVARAIARQMEAQHGRPVFLDATGLRPTYQERREFLARRFPTIDRAVRERGLDWARDPIPVTPAAHYLMGGVTTDLTGRTTLPGLYAVGEVARTGVHGANRLASNSLLEGAVFGARAGDAIASDAASGGWPAAPPRPAPEIPPAPHRSGGETPPAPQSPSAGSGAPQPQFATAEQQVPASPPAPQSPSARSGAPQPQFATAEQQVPASPPAPQSPSARSGAPQPQFATAEHRIAEEFSRAALQELLWEDAGLVRTAAGLEHAEAVLAGWSATSRRPRSEAQFEDENLLLVATRLVHAALRRRESVGAHFRADDQASTMTDAAASVPAQLTVGAA